MELDLLKIVVGIIIFLVLAVTLLNGLVKEGFEDASEPVDTTDATPYLDNTSAKTPAATPDATTPSSTAPSVTATTPSSTVPSVTATTPSSTAPSVTAPSVTAPVTDTDFDSMDISIENSTKLTELFDTVNTQMDIIRTLKIPYSNEVVEIKYLSDDTVEPDTVLQTNLLNLLRSGIKVNDDDLKTNPGIKKYYPYGGNPLIDKLITTISSQCTSVTDLNKCYRTSNQKNLTRIETIVKMHQTILDKIMQKQ